MDLDGYVTDQMMCCSHGRGADGRIVSANNNFPVLLSIYNEFSLYGDKILSYKFLVSALFY